MQFASPDHASTSSQSQPQVLGNPIPRPCRSPSTTDWLRGRKKTNRFTGRHSDRPVSSPRTMRRSPSKAISPCSPVATSRTETRTRSSSRPSFRRSPRSGLKCSPTPVFPKGRPGRAPLFSVGDFILTELSVAAKPASGEGPAQPVSIQHASEDYSEKDRPAALAVDGVPDTGWTVKGGVGQAHAAVFEFREKLGNRSGSKLTLTLRQEGIHQMTIGRFRISATADPGRFAQ